MVSCSPTFFSTSASLNSSIKNSDKGPVIHFCINLDVTVSELLQAIGQFSDQIKESEKAQQEQQIKESEKAQQINDMLNKEIHTKALLMDQVKLQEFQDFPYSDWNDYELPVSCSRIGGFSSWEPLPGSKCLLDEKPLVAWTIPTMETYVANGYEDGTTSAKSSTGWGRGRRYNPVSTRMHNNKPKSVPHSMKKKEFMATDHRTLASSLADGPLLPAPSRMSVITCAIQTLTSDALVDEPSAFSRAYSSRAMTQAVSDELEANKRKASQYGHECKQA